MPTKPYTTDDTVKGAMDKVFERRMTDGFEGREGSKRACDAIDEMATDLGGPIYHEWLKDREKQE